MAMNRAQFASMLEPGLNTLFGLEYDSYPPEYSAVFEANTSSKAYEEDLLLQGFGSAPREIKRVSCCNMRMVLVSLGLQCQMEGGETVYIATPLSML